MKIILFFLMLTPSWLAMGQWFEAQGSAVVRNNDKQAAKSQATQNALKKALLVAGASVSSVQQVVNGLLTQNELNIRASGNVKSVEIVDETYQGNNISVTIRADVISQQTQCFSADYRKGLLLTKSRIIHREQANIGELYNLDKKVIDRLSNHIKQSSRFADVRLAVKNQTKFSLFSQGLYNRQLKDLSISLANLTDSQYILFSEINDLSFDNVVQNSWQFWQTDEFERNFAITIYIYSGTNGELVFEKGYHDFANWSYDKRKKVDVNSATFWRSEYGSMLDKTLNNIMTDIDDNIMCLPTRGKILNVAGNKILINLGSHQGVKIGDEFSLLHLNNFIDQNGQTYAGFNISDYKVKVTQVSQQTAKAITVDDTLLGNIQINDLVVRY
ncbi:MAG: flagella assembly protein FlgT [Alteromonadaceae bacterium]|nr:flagella assembly protein FlgT [Alteromonadaceae bacterium]